MPCIEIENLIHVYFPGTPLETPALVDINLTVEQGEFLALVGAAGSGKSTLARHFNGLLVPTAGRVRVLGGDVADRRYRRQLWRKVGLVFQFPERQIFSGTVQEDIAFGPRNMGLSGAALDERVLWAAEAVQLPEEALRADPNQISGGMRRRAAIAGVLAMRPEILVLDEPGAGLDGRTRERVLRVVKELQNTEKMTVIIITHQLEDAAAYAHRVALLKQGRLLAAGGAGDILVREELLREAGLEPPFTVELAGELSRSGVLLPQTPLTPDDTVKLLAPRLVKDNRKPGGDPC
ncbi:MAG: ATP-binding cassette domain-containing protein [Firmicutes bacterium]|nr:ATP-binding cassette domain-containing protein [Bacillota bacterium]